MSPTSAPAHCPALVQPRGFEPRRPGLQPGALPTELRPHEKHVPGGLPDVSGPKAHVSGAPCFTNSIHGSPGGIRTHDLPRIRRKRYHRATGRARRAGIEPA